MKKGVDFYTRMRVMQTILSFEPEDKSIRVTFWRANNSKENKKMDRRLYTNVTGSSLGRLLKILQSVRDANVAGRQ